MTILITIMMLMMKSENLWQPSPQKHRSRLLTLWEHPAYNIIAIPVVLLSKHMHLSSSSLGDTGPPSIPRNLFDMIALKFHFQIIVLLDDDPADRNDSRGRY